MKLLVLDGRADTMFDRLAVLDIYESLIWTDRYNGYGDFEIYTAPTDEMLQVLAIGNYIWNYESEHVMVIEDVKIETDPEEGNKLYVTGRSFESVLDRRIVWNQTILNGSLQLGIRRLLIDAIIAPEDYDRKIPYFGFKMSDDERITALTVDTQFTGENLYDCIVALCEANNLGWKVTLKDHYISTTGQYGKGNIDLYNRPQYVNEDGSISTVESFSVYLDDVAKEVLLPTIIWDQNGNPAKITEDEAIDRYYETGEYLGMFDMPEDATDYAILLHEDQERLYADKDEWYWLFELYLGTDRSYNQTENPYVVFSPKFDNIAATNYLESSKTLKNVALIGGEGEGADRIMTSIQTEEDVWGLDRREIFVDASDVSTQVTDESDEDQDEEEVYDPYWGYNDDNPWHYDEDDDDDDEEEDPDDDPEPTPSGKRTLSDEEYFKLLQDRGNEELSNYIYTKTFEGEVDTHRMYVYGKDFFMGDLVQMRNEYGIEAVSRITELVISHDTSGLETYPTLAQLEATRPDYQVTSTSGSVSGLINQKVDSDVAALNQRIDEIDIDVGGITAQEIAADFHSVFPEIFT